MNRINGLYAITPDLSDSNILLQLVDAAIRGGIDVLQYRNKSGSPELRLQQALTLLNRCRNAGIPLIINDDMELARQIDADGVHLGNEDGEILAARRLLGAEKIIGASCYNQLQLAHQALADGADYVAFGSVFVSATKPAAKRASLELLCQAKSVLSAPVVAIGGIDQNNIATVAAIGIDAAAVITALFNADSVESAASSLRNHFLQNRN